MSLEQSKSFVSNFLDELYNKGNLALADQVIAPPLLRGAIKRAVQTLREIFSDFHLTIEELIAEEDKVTARCMMRGTYKRNLFGITIVNRSVEVDYIGIYRLGDNQLKAFWFLRDELSLVRQLGLLGTMLLLVKFGKR
ncbi:MAG TPA: ester cyclase [Anaerolineales bacterium]|jgi:predicted ester cyclase|nr:ester cyclase [Anaerolineales bacterium]